MDLHVLYFIIYFAFFQGPEPTDLSDVVKRGGPVAQKYGLGGGWFLLIFF